MLDVGGSHGWFSVELCRANPGLRATIFDWPQAGDIANATIEAEGMIGRISFLEGDFMVDEPGELFDVILLFNVIRIFPASRLVSLFSRVARWMAPGGTIVVMDHLNERLLSRLIRANARIIELELINSVEGAIHRGGDVCRMMKAAGFEKLRKVSILRSPGLGLVSGRKP
jgi:cyclopropane fatty-acyl-phospholipid synthase-like methyltransferase